MLRILLWLWQLPQHLVALFLIYVVNRRNGRKRSMSGYWCLKYGMFNAGVSLGNYILFDSSYCVGVSLTTLNHEKGHQKQSKMLGWFYLLLVGLPSVIRNIYDRVFHKDWEASERIKWYYGSYPENWADKLGGVTNRTS